jgi:hypothetical protein
MTQPLFNTYSLRVIHEEISLLDRKIAHLRKYEVFASESARESAVSRLENKRELLVKSSREMAASGFEFVASELPASLRSGTEAATPETPAEAVETEAADPKPAAHAKTTPPSPFAGTSLDPAETLSVYREARSKPKATPAPRKPRLPQLATASA